MSETQKSSSKPELTDLGWANGNEALYPKWEACNKAGHRVFEISSRPEICVTACECWTCKYVFRIDSSD